MKKIPTLFTRIYEDEDHKIVWITDFGFEWPVKDA